MDFDSHVIGRGRVQARHAQLKGREGCTTVTQLTIIPQYSLSAMPAVNVGVRNFEIPENAVRVLLTGFDVSLAVTEYTPYIVVLIGNQHLGLGPARQHIGIRACSSEGREKERTRNETKQPLFLSSKSSSPKPKNEGQHRIVVIHSICLRTVLQETKDMYITRKNLPSTSTSDVPLSLFQHRRTSPEQLENVSVLENGCLLILLWKLGALSDNDLNNATQFSPSFICKDIVVPAVNRCGIGHVLR